MTSPKKPFRNFVMIPLKAGTLPLNPDLKVLETCLANARKKTSRAEFVSKQIKAWETEIIALSENVFGMRRKISDQNPKSFPRIFCKEPLRKRKYYIGSLENT
jgi:hypothetical protein